MSTTAELLKGAAELFPDEVVTTAHVRHLELPGAGRFALITLDNGLDHTKPTTFGPQSLANLDAAIDQVEREAADGEIVGAGLTGKPFIFAVGADLKGVELLGRHEDALAIGKGGHDVFKRLAGLAVPTFAYYNGASMGGGVEVGLHCTYRTVSRAVPAFSLPEVFLGLVPGWGGCALLPNLIGADRAVTVIIENSLNQNRQLKGGQVFELGIADALFDGADFLEQSLLWTASVLRGETVVERAEVDRGEGWDAAVARGRAIADAKVHGAAPAAYRALEIIAAAKDGDLQAGFDAEDRALADLIMGGELRSGLYAFNLVQKRAKRPAGAPDRSLARPVTKVGVVGAGLMASQLALLFLRRLEVPVVLTDIDQERIDKGVGYVRAEIDKLLGKGRINQDQANRLKALVTGVLDKAEGFADADFVIEAVFEEMGVKQQVFAEVEAVAPAHAILATNTSSLSVSEMASKLKHPERVVGFHFFNPVAILPLLEIVRGERTDEASLATAFAVAKQLKKTAVLVKDAPAFVVNRILTRFMGEIQNVIDEGTPVATAERAVEPLGLPMSPLVLLELVGPAIGLHVSETLNRAFPDRFTVSPNLAAVVKAGKRGFYVYDSGRPELDPEVAALLVQGDAVLTEEQVRARVLEAVAQEIGLMLDEGVVAEAQDIDLCLITGAGWPFHLGGITPYLDREGVSERVNGKPFLAPGVASVPA
ncbi:MULTISPECIES: 3-hydroxyacyl-CoA dehydrogenase NAD-binding domain-containing protein [Streptomyces]|uniref:3-hydroxyacyl-CoA dehydrogenase n=1 Tax=Streptomyces tsukubensis (strain DSM 42081 / NBRC 108919 / NRRL 18488 / 9993) TaxID=1114943 RepID=I2N8G2_STRT9|nr:3-hydroxyacyl-CoA dehydrogenase NAD-binding domain-containing protein [Streptomyces tsukubensis]MYS62846.1 3-hydroxyacyl-CoA dehydrogenase [Streptomyces sp. SID5473]AZK97190.1 3-hydroxyacyl-CoA dehydrogenase [Streptomyces tsukubensis]EIF93309.1 fatty acid oxidation complex alpha-subunit [Streptomyces tsukubensis NRRL18488]QKM66842.1 3-hydroxyacyl-CoA dehydrogenase [Streptomyces tsukubensis NRRL18488]TAI44810.1 3-hydroxyacyl-CoA dehydrogenase [Streptomyces tsukubensis]